MLKQTTNNNAPKAVRRFQRAPLYLSMLLVAALPFFSKHAEGQVSARANASAMIISNADTSLPAPVVIDSINVALNNGWLRATGKMKFRDPRFWRELGGEKAEKLGGYTKIDEYGKTVLHVFALTRTRVIKAAYVNHPGNPEKEILPGIGFGKIEILSR